MRPAPFTDPYPGQPRILFMGLPHSTHTHSWIQLLEGESFNTRLFGVHSNPVEWQYMLAAMPTDWRVPTYVSMPIKGQSSVNANIYFPARQSDWLPWRIKARLGLLSKDYNLRLLCHVIESWQPDIVHTLGLDPAGYTYFDMLKKYLPTHRAKWVLQLRGGSDLTLTRHNPDLLPKIKQTTAAADQIISDNMKNFDYLREIDISSDYFADISPVPGTGGIDVKTLTKTWQPPTSLRRMILFPKAYESPWSLALPVFEALRLCWDEIQPCEIYLLAMTTEATRMWYWDLPQAIRDHCHVIDRRLSRDETLKLMSKARVMLAPSLVDGVPNTMYEAMASGAVPVVSPLETIKDVVKNEENVLFCRNLYPQEIAAALTRIMTDDALVDQIVKRNLDLVTEIADRDLIRNKTVNYYKGLVNFPDPHPELIDK